VIIQVVSGIWLRCGPRVACVLPVPKRTGMPCDRGREPACSSAYEVFTVRWVWPMRRSRKYVSGGRPAGDRGSQRVCRGAAAGGPAWRSSSGATENRNTRPVELPDGWLQVAVVLRGGRGSQRLCQWPILGCRLQGGWWFGGQEVRCQSVGCSHIVVVRGRGAGIGSRIICVARLLWPGLSPSVSVLGMWPSTWRWCMT
jgi:hypothetical protein